MNKLLKISVSFNRGSNEPACITIIDNENGYEEEVRGTVENIKDKVYQLLHRWHKDGRGTLTPEVFDYYATYVDYEVRRKEMSDQE